jgi:hypothetical protein
MKKVRTYKYTVRKKGLYANIEVCDDLEIWWCKDIIKLEKDDQVKLIITSKKGK